MRVPDPAEWLVVLRPDGVVDEVNGGAPSTWLGRTLDDTPGVSDAVRRAARELLAGESSGVVERRRVPSEERGQPVVVEILLVQAVPLRRTHVRVDDLLLRTMDVFASQARSSEVVLDAEHGDKVPPVIVVDGEKIAWVLATLVGNALRYAGERREAKKRARVSVRMGWDDARSQVVMTVADNGPGMTPERVRWLFERDPRSGRSAGLALVMVRDVVLAHRGSIEVTSAIGEGTVFTIRLPRPVER